jgi:hypothetical protein
MKSSFLPVWNKNKVQKECGLSMQINALEAEKCDVFRTADTNSPLVCEQFPKQQ